MFMTEFQNANKKIFLIFSAVSKAVVSLVGINKLGMDEGTSKRKKI